MGDAFLDTEDVGFMAVVPAEKLGEREEGGDYDEGKGSVATGGGAAGVCGFGFGWWGVLAGAFWGTRRGSAGSVTSIARQLRR